MATLKSRSTSVPGIDALRLAPNTSHKILTAETSRTPKDSLCALRVSAVNSMFNEPTADLLTQQLQAHEKTAWMLRSLLE